MFLLCPSMQSIQNLGLAVIAIAAGMILDTRGYLFLELFFSACVCCECGVLGVPPGGVGVFVVFIFPAKQESFLSQRCQCWHELTASGVLGVSLKCKDFQCLKSGQIMLLKCKL